VSDLAARVKSLSRDSLSWRMSYSENRFALFRDMHYDAIPTTPSASSSSDSFLRA
jgi:hypothetical protein